MHRNKIRQTITRLLSVGSKPFAVRMFTEGLTWHLITTFRNLHAQVQTQKIQVQTPKHRHTSINIDNIHKIHDSNTQQCVFCSRKKAPAAAVTQTQRAWGTQKSTKLDARDTNRQTPATSTNYMLSKSRGVIFQETQTHAAAATQTRRAWRTQTSTKILNTYIYIYIYIYI